jgi:hypothetical protein
MDRDVNNGRSNEREESDASCGRQFASDIDNKVGGIGKCKNVSSCIHLELLK